MLRILGGIFDESQTINKGQSGDTIQVTLSTVMISDELDALVQRKSRTKPHSTQFLRPKFN